MTAMEKYGIKPDVLSDAPARRCSNPGGLMSPFMWAKSALERTTASSAAEPASCPCTLQESLCSLISADTDMCAQWQDVHDLVAICT